MCPGCSTGCNIQVEAHDNRVARFKPRINEAVNGHWLCDEGRYCFRSLTEAERLTTPLIRQEGGLVSADWDTVLGATVAGLQAHGPAGLLLSGRNTNEDAFLFARLMRAIAPEAGLEVFYQERELSEVARILMSPDRSPNFRGAKEMGVQSDGGFDSWARRLVEGKYGSAFIVGEDLVSSAPDQDGLTQALKRLSFLVVQDTTLSATGRLAHVVLPSTNFAEKDGTYTNRKGRVQRLQAALVPPQGVLHDCEIFNRLLALAGQSLPSPSPADIFRRIAKEVPRYQGLIYEEIGDLGTDPDRDGAAR